MTSGLTSIHWLNMGNGESEFAAPLTSRFGHMQAAEEFAGSRVGQRDADFH
jgi:hypothetical protein